jgi:hypothetical protein
VVPLFHLALLIVFASRAPRSYALVRCSPMNMSRGKIAVLCRAAC